MGYEKELVMIPWLTIELTNHCNKACYFCGRAQIRDSMELGNMDIYLFKKILNEYEGSVLQFSRDGDPLMYPNLRNIGILSKHLVTNIVTNGNLLWEKREDIFNMFSTVTVSVINNDQEQFDIVRRFIEWKGVDNPQVYIKFVGDTYNHDYEELGLKTMRRVVHHPHGDWEYATGHEPLLPELGVCQDFLFKPSISWDGKFSICNRFDPQGMGVIGDCNTHTLKQIWNSPIRQKWLGHHLAGRRESINICKRCEFWGVPRYI